MKVDVSASAARAPSSRDPSSRKLRAERRRTASHARGGRGGCVHTRTTSPTPTITGSKSTPSPTRFAGRGREPTRAGEGSAP